MEKAGTGIRLGLWASSKPARGGRSRSLITLSIAV